MRFSTWESFREVPSPFGDGELEALDGLPEGFDITQMPEAPHEYTPALDKNLKRNQVWKGNEVKELFSFANSGKYRY